MKRILSLLLSTVLAFSSIVSAFASPELHAATKFSQILDNLQSMGDSAGVSLLLFSAVMPVAFKP